MDSQLPEYKQKYFKEQEKFEKQPKDLKQEMHLQKMCESKQKEDSNGRYQLSAATNTNDIWYSNQYKKEEWRSNLNESLYKKSHDQKEFAHHEYNPDVKEQRFNSRKTRISEYSNARHNNRVFINPTFTSC